MGSRKLRRKPIPASGASAGTDVEGIKTFKGMHGATTAGRNRFMPPLDPAKWTGVRDALEYGSSAPQREPGVQSGASALAVGGGAAAAGRRRGLPRAERLDTGREAAAGPSSPRGCCGVMAAVSRPGRARVPRHRWATEPRPPRGWSSSWSIAIHRGWNVLGFTLSGRPPGGTPFAQSGDVRPCSTSSTRSNWVLDNIAEFGGDPGAVTVLRGSRAAAARLRRCSRCPSAQGLLFHRADHRKRCDDQIGRARAGRARSRASSLAEARATAFAAGAELQTPVDRIMSAYFETVRTMNVDQIDDGFLLRPSTATAVPGHPFHPTASGCGRPTYR